MLVLIALAAAGPAVGAEMNAVAINGRHLLVVKKVAVHESRETKPDFITSRRASCGRSERLVGDE